MSGRKGEKVIKLTTQLLNTKLGFLGGVICFIIMLISYYLALEGNQYFDYIENLGTSLTIMFVITLLYKNGNNNQAGDFTKRKKYIINTLILSIYIGLVYGIISYIYIKYFEIDYTSNMINAVLKLPYEKYSASESVGRALGAQLTYNTEYHFFYKILQSLTLGLLYLAVIFIVNLIKKVVSRKEF